MKSISRNFNDNETFITDYRIKDAQGKDAQIIVKTASEEYYTAPYTIEDLEAIRNRMIQEYFDADAYEMATTYKAIVSGLRAILEVLFLVESIVTCSLITNMFLISLGVTGSLGLMCLATKNLYQVINSLLKIKASRKRGPNTSGFSLLDSMDRPRVIRNNEKVNIRFNQKFRMPRVICSTLEQQTFFWPEELDEFEYTELNQISKSNIDWDNLPDYNNHRDFWKEESHAKRKKKHKNRISSTPKRKEILSEQEKQQQAYIEKSFYHYYIKPYPSINEEPDINTGFSRVLKK